ncbi:MULTISPECIES: DNA-binding transcriptional regulator [Psychrobacter]|uniref:helix-turn-helix domain-containing protein n=1 Tax=Psychrobacter TaxID=497 RepID=UPI00146E9DCC|nr:MULTISPECIES: helix-turn-helix domain-containing protein [Psychrobacter]
MAIKTMNDLDNIDLADHEFTGDELGALLLESIRQAKAGQGVVREQTALNEAVEARQNVGLSQQEFAEILGVSVRTLQAWEQGKRNPSKAASVLLKIAKVEPKVLLRVAH